MSQANDGGFAAWRDAPLVGRPGHPYWAYAAVAFALYGGSFYIAFRYGMSFSQVTASPFWFPDSVLLCALLLAPKRWWWVFILGALPIRLAHPIVADLPPWFVLGTFLIDSIKGVVTALALRRCLDDPLRLRTMRDLALYGAIVVVAVPAIGAFAGAALREGLGHAYWISWRQWFLGNALTHLVVTPAILYGLFGGARAIEGADTRRWIEGMVVAAGLVVTGYAAFLIPAGSGGFTEPQFYAQIPFLFWAALRFGLPGASGAVVTVAVISVHAALEGNGAFAGLSPNDTALALQQFLLLRAVPLYMVAILIEQSRVAQDGLSESERRYREVVENQPELLCRFLPDGRLTFVNEAFCRAYGRRREALVDCDLFELFPVAAREAVRAHIDFAFREGRAEWECQSAQPDVNPVWKHWVCHRVNGPRGEIEEFQAIGHDITDRKRAEEANRNLAHASRLAVVGELTAMVAHEINQPLGAILSNADAAEMLLSRKDPPLDEIRAILSDIRRSDLRANEAILRIRALLRKTETCLVPMDFNEAVVDVLRLAAGDLLRRQIRVRTDLQPVVRRVLADRVQMQHVLLNLFVNAMDAMNDVAPPDRLLEISTRYDGHDAIEVVVCDSGHGIPDDKLSEIFVSFFTTKASGMGLGLSIVRTILDSHQGRIWAENRRGGGAAIHFTVRLAP